MRVYPESRTKMPPPPSPGSTEDGIELNGAQNTEPAKRSRGAILCTVNAAARGWVKAAALRA